MTDTPPPIQSVDELITREELARQFGVSERTVDGWRYGRSAANVPLPYLRFVNKIWTWKGALVWWLNKHAERPDPYYIDTMRKLKEGKKVGRTRS